MHQLHSCRGNHAPQWKQRNLKAKKVVIFTMVETLMTEWHFCYKSWPNCNHSAKILAVGKGSQNKKWRSWPMRMLWTLIVFMRVVLTELKIYVLGESCPSLPNCSDVRPISDIPSRRKVAKQLIWRGGWGYFTEIRSSLYPILVLSALCCSWLSSLKSVIKLP